MQIRPKAKRRIALLGAVILLGAAGGGLALHVANKREWARLDAERVGALADYSAGNFAGALPHLRHYLEKDKDGEEANSDHYLAAMFAYGKCRMNVRQGHNAHLFEAKSILQNYLARRPNDREAQYALLSIYPQIEYQQEQLALADAVLALHPDDEKALVAKVQALMNQTRPALEEARKVCDRLNAKWPSDLQGQLLGMEIRLRTQVPPAELVARAESLRRDHENDPRFELLLGATYLGVSRLPVRADRAAAPEAAGATASGTAGAAVAAVAPPAGGAPAATTGPAAPSESARAEWHAQGLHWLESAAERTPPDAEFVRIFVATSDLNDLYPQSLDLLRKDAPALHDRQLDAALAQRLWENHYDRELVERTAGLDRRQPSADVASLAYRAAALYELAAAADAASPTTAPDAAANTAARNAAPANAKAEAAAIVQSLADRKDDPSAEAWATLLRAQYAPGGAAGATANANAGGAAREMVKQCQLALSKDPDNAFGLLLSGEGYADLGEKETAAARWEEAAWRAPEWSMPYALIARLRLGQGRNDEALARAQAALKRSPHVRAVRAAFVLAWDAVLKESSRGWGKGDGRGDGNGKDGAWDRLLKEVKAVQEQWPREPETLPLYVELLADSGQKDAAAEVARSAAAATPPPPTATLLALDEVSRSRGLGLGKALVERAVSADGNSIDVAVRRALDPLGANEPAKGLEILKAAQKAAGGEDNPAWRVAVAGYLERAGDPSAAKTWVELGDKFPTDLTVQSAVLQSATRYEDRAFWKRSIDRLKALTGEEGQLWRLERCRWLLSGAADGTAAKDRSEAITTLTELTREFPGEAEPHRLLAFAFEAENKPDRAAEEMNSAVSLRPGDVEASLELARLLRSVGKGTEAQAALDRTARRPGLTPAARRLLASAYEQQGNPQKAVDLLTAAGAGSSASSGSTNSAGAAGPHTRPAAGDDSGAADVARDGMLARLYARLGKFDQAEALYNKLLDNPSAPPQDLADGAELFAAEGKADRASEFLTRLAGLNLPDGAIQVIMGRFHERFGRNNEALQSFTEATTVSPRKPAAWLELAKFHLRHGELPDAAAAAEQGMKAAPGESALPALAKDVAALRRLQKSPQLASLEAALATDPADPAATDLLNALLETQDRAETTAQRAARLKDVVGRHPDFFAAREQLILAYLEQNQFQSAADVAAAAVQSAPYDPAPARLATGVYLTAGQTARALDAAMAWRQRSGPDTLLPDLAIADALLTLDRPREAADRLAPYLRKPAAPAPLAPGAPGAAGSTAKAESPLPVSVSSPADPNLTLYRLYARALIATGRGAEASALLTSLVSETSGETAAAARRVWLSLAPAHKSADAASAWLEQITPKLSDNSADERFALAEAWREVGSRLSSVPALQKARDLLAPMIHRPDADISAWALAAEVAQELGDYDTAEQGWRRLLQAATANGQTVRPEVRNNLAYVLMIRGDKSSLPEARQLAEQAVAAAPESSVFYDTLARIYSRLGNRDQAVKTFRTALDKDPANLEAMIGLADALSHDGTREDAAAARALLPRINRAMEKGTSLSGPLQEQLKSVRSRASLDTGDGR